MTASGDDQRERQQEIAGVLAKILGVAVAIGLVIGLGAWIMVKALGLSAGEDAAGPGPGGVRQGTPLPTTALPVPSATPPSNNPGLVTTTPAAPGVGDLSLTASPVVVKPMERINLTGQWPGHDNEGLMVQRLEGGQWSDFGVQVRVNVGTFGTYVMTGRAGDQKFRVYDPKTKTASNEVTVTVGS